jgi:hypothetical protein
MGKKYTNYPVFDGSNAATTGIWEIVHKDQNILPTVLTEMGKQYTNYPVLEGSNPATDGTQEIA